MYIFIFIIIIFNYIIVSIFQIELVHFWPTSETALTNQVWSKLNFNQVNIFKRIHVLHVKSGVLLLAGLHTHTCGYSNQY